MKELTTKTIAECFKKSALTLKALPASNVQAQSSLFYKAIKSLNESTLAKSNLVRLFEPSNVVTMLQQTFKWSNALDEQSRELVWKWAAGVSWKMITKELGCSKTTAWRRLKQILQDVVDHLKENNGSNIGI